MATPFQPPLELTRRFWRLRRCELAIIKSQRERAFSNSVLQQLEHIFSWRGQQCTVRSLRETQITVTIATEVKKRKSRLLALSNARYSTRRRGNLRRAKLVNHLLGDFAK